MWEPMCSVELRGSSLLVFWTIYRTLFLPAHSSEVCIACKNHTYSLGTTGDFPLYQCLSMWSPSAIYIRTQTCSSFARFSNMFFLVTCYSQVLMSNSRRHPKPEVRSQGCRLILLFICSQLNPKYLIQPHGASASPSAQEEWCYLLLK